MDIVGSRLSSEDHGGRCGELRAGVEGLEFGFLHGIGVGQRGLRGVGFAAEVPIGHGRAVLRIFHSFLHNSIGACAVRLETRYGVLGESENIAPILRKLVDSIGIELRADCAAVVGRELNSVRLHGNLLGYVADRQLGIEDNHLRVLQRDRGLVLLHSGGAESDCVIARKQAWRGVEAAAIRGGVIGDARILVDDMD